MLLILQISDVLAFSQTLGDLGLVAKASRRTQALMKKPEPLTVINVLEAFRDIAEVCSSFM